MFSDTKKLINDPDLFKCGRTPSKRQQVFDELVKHLDPEDAAYAAERLTEMLYDDKHGV